MPLSIPQEIVDLIIHQLAVMNMDRRVSELRACRLGPRSTLYLSSCALVSRSWVWSSRSHQFRTLHFVNWRQVQRISGFLGLIRSPFSTINKHVFEIDTDLFTLLVSDMVALASLSNLQSVGLRGSASPLEEVSWKDGLPMFLASFAHLTKLKISLLPFASLEQFATLVGTCSELQTLSIKIADLPLDSLSQPYIPRYFPPPSLRCLRITESNAKGCCALYDWLSSAAKPLPIDSIDIQTYGGAYTASVLNLLRNARSSLESLEINTSGISTLTDELNQPPLPDLNPYPRLQSFTCRWSMYIRSKSPAVQAAEICRAIGQISSSCMRTIEIIIEMHNPADIEELALQTIDLDLQRPNFASLQRLTFFTVFSELETIQEWTRETFPVCFQRGTIQLRNLPPRPWC